MDAAVGTTALTFAQMREDIAEALEYEPSELSEDEDLLVLGLDSLAVMRLASRWRSQGAPVGFKELIEWRTLGQWWRLVGEAGSDQVPVPDLVEVDPKAPFGLATMQQAYWIGRAEGQPLGGVGAHFYNEFDGHHVDADRLAHAVRAVLARHPMLRAVFHADGTQQILDSSPWPGLQVHDLRHLPADQLQRRLQQLRNDISHRRLRVDQAETFDVQLSMLPDGATRMHVHVEMLVADARSFRLLMSDLAAYYEKPDAQLPTPELTFAAYLATDAANPDPTRDRAAQYWRDRLTSLPGPPELPLAVDPAHVTRHRTTRHHHWLTPQQQQDLVGRAASAGVTPAVVFLTAFAEVLAAWSASPRFVLNLPLYDRRPLHPDVDAVVGDFTNLVLLEIDATGPTGFVAAAHRHQQQLRADAAHSAFTGMDVMRELARLRGGQPTGAPVVFTSALSLGELFDERVRSCFGAPGHTMSQTPQVWLDHQITEREQGLYLHWDVVAELFPDGVVEGMFSAYRQIIDWLLDPRSDWSQPAPLRLPPASLAAREAANDTAADLPDRLLHAQVFAHAVAHPDRVAVRYEDGQLTYQQLTGRAQALADDLIRAGVQPGHAVAVTLPKGPEQIIAVLAVLQAGGVYVPIGLDQPAHRRALITSAAGARICIAAAPQDADHELTTLPVPERVVPLRSSVPVDPAQPAYLLFTSGSTGAPKGVRVSHRAACNTIDDLTQRCDIGPDDSVLAVSALDFDLSVFDIFALLGVGGTVVTLTEQTRRDPEAWLRMVHTHHVTIWQSVPAVLDLLLTAAGPGGQEPAQGRPMPLRWALVGGDWVDLDLASRLAVAAPQSQLVALGGTTETAIHSTVQLVPAPPPAHWRSVPYGVPLRNQLLRVVDDAGRDRPDWVPGELWIGGRSVALGYEGDPDRTAEQFVSYRGQAWYRTGDLARYWPDGTVEFLGRRDFQVKIRGHRIELGEIEAALRSDPRVHRCVAVAVGQAAECVLGAAVTAADPADPPDVDALRKHLADRLPTYMVPTALTVLPDLPMSANAKIDRKRLAELLVAPTGTEVGQAPQGELEHTVAQIWADLLGVAEVRRDENFFLLGGDSLIATRMLTRLSAAGITGAQLRTLFATPTLQGFVATLQRDPTSSQTGDVLRADPQRRYEPFPPTDVQRAYWLGRSDDFALGGVGSHWYWEFDGADVDLDRLEDAVNTLISRHDMLRAVFDSDGNQRVLASVPRLRLQVADGAAELEPMRQRLSHRVPDPATWPLVEIHAVRYDGRTRVAFSFDYIVLDALSIVIFFSELSTLYQDPAASLPPIGVTFRDYVLGAEPDANQYAKATDYWRRRLNDLAAAAPLPLAVDPSTVRNPRFRRRERHLSPAQWRALTERARQHQLTPAAVLATAYAEVLSAFSGADAMTLNLTMFQRRDVHPDIEAVLGDFTSLMLVGYRADPSTQFLPAARALHHDLWDGLEHNAVSALWVLRELTRVNGGDTVTMPIVFTSALGVASELVNLRFPFGELVAGLSQTPQVWLDNQVMERDGGLSYNWDSVDELFPAGLVDAMFEAYHRLLCWLADGQWDRPLPDLLPAGQRQIRAQVNATAAALPSHTLHGPFFDRAAAEPERIALAYGEQTVSYGALADHALRLAGALTRAGVTPGDPVAVHVPRGPDQVAAVLGVLAAGACYVPVGVEQPASRRDRIFATAGVRVVISDGLAGHGDVTVVSPDAAGPPLAAPVAVAVDALAYITFTSGSTGEPKGVEIAHGAAVNTVADINERYHVGPDDRVLAVSSIEFDLSVYDIFGLLAAGGAVVLVPEGEQREARRWAEQVQRWKVTIWNSVPALLDMLLVACTERPPQSLRLALISGDWVGLDLPGRLAAVAPAQFVALGGATEAAIWSNACDVADVPPHWRSVPYGLPLRNQRYRVVDPRGRDCPDWVAGELWIGGAGVAQGYRNAPEITAAQFVTDAHGHRWYRTGDLGRYWPDGTLEFLGRRDSQVKVRGHRIELGEVEAIADTHPQVDRTVAVVAGRDNGRYLALAVLTSAPDAPADLADWLANRLPGHMVPERITALAELPLTSNGKVDRRQLAQMLSKPVDLARQTPPQTATERALAEVWQQLLEVPIVDREQSFFSLGGDSLLATRLVEALRQRFGITVTLRQLFTSPTLAQLGAIVDGQFAHAVDVDHEEGVI